MRWLISSISLLFLLNGSRAEACPYCFSSVANSLKSYFGTTILLTLLPLVILGGLGWYLRLIAKKKEN